MYYAIFKSSKEEIESKPKLISAYYRNTGLYTVPEDFNFTKNLPSGDWIVFKINSDWNPENINRLNPTTCADRVNDEDAVGSIVFLNWEGKK